MTRTERSVFPRAVIKDRSESRSGLDKSIRKNGAGQHNWGSLAHEQDLEDAAVGDEELEFVGERDADSLSSSSESVDDKKSVPKSSAALTEEEMESAKKFRKNAFKSGGVDLAAIARSSSAVSTSPPSKGAPIAVVASTV